jgi:hypothetical protein
MAPKSSTVEEILAKLAGKSHGVVTRRELLEAGVTVDEIRERLEKGRCYGSTAVCTELDTGRRASRRGTSPRFARVVSERRSAAKQPPSSTA